MAILNSDKNQRDEICFKGEKMAFCRCWQSKKFPFCDGSHREYNQLHQDKLGPVVLVSDLKSEQSTDS
jgi:CDGSH-type Zn-finger protein